MLGYACYTERFADSLASLPARLDYLQDLGVTYLHLMPLLRRARATTTVATRCRTTGRYERTWGPSRTFAR